MKIENKTINKLTTMELNDLECFHMGIIPLCGTPKSRVKGFKTTLRTEYEIHYENEFVRHEMVKLANETDDKYAYRIFDKEHNEYIKFAQPTWALNFIK